jgi:hypothetical protein
MGPRGKLSRALPWLLLAALVCAGATLCGAALGASVQTGNVRISFKGSLSPRRLPRDRPVPVVLRLSGTISTRDGSHVPPVRTLTLALNRHGVFDTAGIPACRPASLSGTNTEGGKRICGRALIGTGTVTGEVLLPQQAPFPAHGPLLIFNGGTRHGGRQLLVMQAFAYLPAPTTFLTTAVVREGRGRLGSRIEVKVPTIAAGQGSLTGFHATFRRGVEASCPAPGSLHATLYPLARASLGFAGSVAEAGTVFRHCSVRR